MSEYIIDWDTGLVIDTFSKNNLREEIVRCRDCVKFSEQEPDGEIGTCELGLEDTGLVSIVEPNGFCAWGERRANG